MIRKNRFVEELTEGDQVEDLFQVRSARLGETRAGKPYLVLTLGDRSGEISGPVWDHAETVQQFCTAGAVVAVKAQVQTYRDQPQLRIDTVRPVTVENGAMAAFVAASRRSPQSMKAELRELIDTIGNRYLSQLLRRIFQESEEGTRFQEAPAAKGIHHAYLGGLLEHSLSMARVASLLAGHYSGIDRDLLVAGALLHDIGKIQELRNLGGAIDYTDSGRLKGHLVIGCELIGRTADRIEQFPEELLTQLQHLVLSHHGRQEFGSPVVPMTPEALLLSFIDDLDAKMNLVEQLRRKLKAGASGWSDYQRSLERYLWLTPLGEEQSGAGSEAPPVEEEPPGRQRSLF